MKRKDKKNKSTHNSPLEENRNQPHVDVSDLVLWKRPLMTTYYAFREILTVCGALWTQFITKKRLVILLILVITFLFLNQTPGSHQKIFDGLRENILQSLYWLGLGVLSTVGFGFGLHTFVLYLTPHLIAVTLAAYVCQSVEPPYPDKMVCPYKIGEVTPWTIFHMVMWECFMFGVGTAIGELPPYFMARTSRLSGTSNEDETNIEELLQKRQSSQISFKDKCKLFIQDLVNKAGFLGILVCASVPNPLYDLAGVTCGHFLVPFWKFFGATFIGKAIVKMSLQTLFVIFVFSEKHCEHAIQLIKKMPFIGPMIGPTFEGYLEKQKYKLQHPEESQNGLLPWVFNFVVLAIMMCFLVSVLNTLAQSYKRRRSMQVNKRDMQK